jgi:hypothetical protein
MIISTPRSSRRASPGMATSLSTTATAGTAPRTAGYTAPTSVRSTAISPNGGPQARRRRGPCLMSNRAWALRGIMCGEHARQGGDQRHGMRDLRVLPGMPRGRRQGACCRAQGGDCDGCCRNISRARGCFAGCPVVTVAVAGEVDPAHPPLRRAGVLVGLVRPAQRGRLRRDPDHRRLPAADLRVQRRRAALDLAGAVLLDRRVRHRPLSPRLRSPKTRRIQRTWRSPTLAACRVAWRWSSGGYWPSRNTWSSACSPAAGSGWPRARATPATSTRPAAGGSSVSWR